jgi:hypothetical protein
MDLEQVQQAQAKGDGALSQGRGAREKIRERLGEETAQQSLVVADELLALVGSGRSAMTPKGDRLLVGGSRRQRRWSGRRRPVCGCIPFVPPKVSHRGVPSVTQQHWPCRSHRKAEMNRSACQGSHLPRQLLRL